MHWTKCRQEIFEVSRVLYTNVVKNKKRKTSSLLFSFLQKQEETETREDVNEETEVSEGEK